MQQQAAHSQELATLRSLRGQLQQALASEAASSSDDEQLYSDQGLEEQRALSKDLAIEAGIWIVAPEAKAAQVLLQAGKCLKLGKQPKTLWQRIGRISAELQAGRPIKPSVHFESSLASISGA